MTTTRYPSALSLIEPDHVIRVHDDVVERDPYSHLLRPYVDKVVGRFAAAGYTIVYAGEPFTDERHNLRGSLAMSRLQPYYSKTGDQDWRLGEAWYLEIPADVRSEVSDLLMAISRRDTDDFHIFGGHPSYGAIKSVADIARIMRRAIERFDAPPDRLEAHYASAASPEALALRRAARAEQRRDCARVIDLLGRGAGR